MCDIVEEADGSVRHRLAARGGSGDNGDLWDTIGLLDDAGCARYVVTDVSRDGTLEGPNVDLYRAVTRSTKAAVIASGGISSIADLEALARLSSESDHANLEGSIVGQALYAGRFTLTDALAAVRLR